MKDFPNIPVQSSVFIPWRKKPNIEDSLMQIIFMDRQKLMHPFCFLIFERINFLLSYKQSIGTVLTRISLQKVKRFTTTMKQRILTILTILIYLFGLAINLYWYFRQDIKPNFFIRIIMTTPVLLILVFYLPTIQQLIKK